MTKISVERPERPKQERGTNPIFRSTRTNAPTGHLIFCDQSAVFLNDHKDFFTNTFKPIIKKEVNRRAQRQRKSIQEQIGVRGTAGNRSSTQSKRESKEEKERINVGKNAENHFEASFNKSENISLSAIFDNLIYYIPQKRGKYTPAKSFCSELINNLNNPVMLSYLKTLAENCSFWVKRKEEQILPIVFPERVRRHEKKGRKYKYKNIDHRGFRNPKGGENPIRDLAKKNPKLEKNISGKNKKSKGMRISTGIYKGMELDYGFEACHIWYDTTEAPPLFTFVPNVTWLPQMISRLSDKVVQNSFFPPLLKVYSKSFYKSHSAPLKPIVNGCWEGLKNGDEEPIENLDNFKNIGKLGSVKNKFGLKAGLRKNISQNILTLLQYIDSCIKGEAPDSDPQSIPKRQVELFGGEEKLNEYRESYTTDNQKPTHRNSNLEGGWTREFLEYVADQQGINPKSKKFEVFRTKFKPGYRAELKQFIEPLVKKEKKNKINSEKAFELELQTWLKNYYNALTKIQDKKKLESYMAENGMDLNDLSKNDLEKLSTHFNIDETAVKRNVKEMLEKEEVIDKKKQAEELKKMQEFVFKLSDRNPIQSKK